MQLENQLYEIIESGDKVFRLRLLPESVIFKAHFPGFPVLPGVCMVRVVTELAEKILCCRLSLSEMRNVKFLGVVSPVDTPEVDFTFDHLQISGHEVAAKGTVSNNGTVFSKFSLKYNIID